MKRKVAKLRLSPNEEARLIREEHERRRKLRIQQVREQQRYISLQILREVEQRRQRELEQLEKQLREDWERQQREKLHALQRLYQESLQLVGQGHRSAKENEPDLEAIAQREEENHVKAEERYREALKELKSQRLKEEERQSRCINARKKALQAEKERSAKVASLPLPLPNPIQSIDSKKLCIVKKSDVSAFATTHYHMPECTVDREADTKQPNAHKGAELEVRRLQDLEREEKQRREEQLEKARLRGKEALRREHLVQDRERLFIELEHMQQTDLLRRRQQVSQMPPQIFQPLLKRQETREDFQREMEFAFEDMYTGERRVKGDLVVQLVPEPLPALSTRSHDQELDVSLDGISPHGEAATQHDAEREAGSTELEFCDKAESTKPAPRRALKKLLDRIRSQKNQWTDNGSSDSAAESLTPCFVQISEPDTTINTGSLTSEEKSLVLPTELRASANAAPALETTKQSTAADPPLSDSLASRVREFKDGRKRRAEELEREKQEQVVLLQELEEQKAKLEQMLLEAQQEREDLKAVVTQDEPLNSLELPVHDQDVTSVPPGIATELMPPASKDDHARRIKEYQQRLLEQNKIHQRSVEVARHRLEEYQRALRIRYNLNVASLQPAVGPSAFVAPLPLHHAQPAHLPAPLQLLTTPAAPGYFHGRPLSPVEVPRVESDMLLPPSELPGSKLLPPSAVGCLSNDTRGHRPDVTTWLTDNIMERVTEHLPVRVRPSSEPPSHHLLPTRPPASIPSEPVRAISPCTADGVPPVVRGPMSHGSLPPGYPCSGEEADSNMERQRLQLLEVKRRALEQREAVALQQRWQEEEQQRREEQQREQEAEMEQMRRQKEMLQALIHTEEPLVPEAAAEVVVSEDIAKTRLKLLASLLRAIEESNGGTLAHLEAPEDKDHSPRQLPSDSEHIRQSNVPAGPASVSVFPSGFYPPPRAAKPPVTRFRLCATEVMMEQHELSAIQEVETPVDSSQVAGLEDSGTVPSQALCLDQQKDLESSTSSDRTEQAPSWSSSRQRSAERSSGLSSGGTWRERLPMGTSPESSGFDSVGRVTSPLSSDSGRGADYSGPAVTCHRPSTESAHRPHDSDCLSSTTISTGSYITTDPELNVDADKSPSLRHCAEPGRGEHSLDILSPSAHSSCIIDSSVAGRPGQAVDSLFNDSSIQHIIDKYTRELNLSLSAAGRTTDSEGSYLEQHGSSVSEQALVGVSERGVEDERSLSRRSLPSDTEGDQKGGLVSDSQPTIDPILEHFLGEDPTIAEYQEQDSFRPLIGQLADQSSCLAAEPRDSAMQQLVGLPFAHSSVICQPPGPSGSVSFDQGRWDSTLSHMISRLSHQPSSHWPSGGQDFYADYLTGRVASEQATTGLDGDLEESQMRPLVVEQDESAGQDSESSDERTLVDLGVSTEGGVPLYPVLPPEPSSDGASASAGHPHHQTAQDQISPLDLVPERTEAFPDSFHPMLAEITHNETADPSMTFHLPEHNVPTSPEGQPASGEHAVSTSSVGFETNTDESDPSPERLRAEEPSSCVEASPALQDSFSQLIASQCRPHESVLMLSPDTRTDGEPAALLSRLTVCDYPPTVEIMEGADEDRNHVCPLLDRILEAAGEKGILEQSEITLVSLTDTTLQDQETIVSEEEEKREDKHREGVEEKGLQAHETEGSKSTLLWAGSPEDGNNPFPVTLLEFQWGPGKDLQEVHQQKRRALLQRSSRRVEGIKIKVNAKESNPAPRKAKMKSETPRQINAKSKGGPAEPHRTTKKSASIQQKRPLLPPPATDPRINEVCEVKSSTSEQRKRDVSEMHQRTQRLYEQLEEVKHQKAIRNRLQSYEANRLKAKEFHKKTLQNLRAKQT